MSKIKPPYQSPDPAMCLKLASDFLLRLELNELVAAHGIYTSMTHSELWNAEKSANLQPLLKDKPGCTCCMVGGLWYSNIMLNDKVTVYDWQIRNHHEYLYPFFGRDQVRVLEGAFESFSTVEVGSYELDTRKYFCQIGLDGDLVERELEEGELDHEAYQKAHAASTARRILKNIIRHGGIFLLPEMEGYIPDEWDNGEMKPLDPKKFLVQPSYTYGDEEH